MVFFQNWPIKFRLVLLSMLSSTIALALACSAIVIHEQITAKARLDRYYLALARITGENCAAGLMFNEPDSVGQTLGSLWGESTIISATVLDRDGALFAEFTREGGAGELPERHAPIWHRIMLDGEQIGTLVLIADMGGTTARLMRYLLIVGAVLAGSSLVAFFLSARLQRIISEPLVELAQIVTRVAREKDYSLRVPPGGPGEIGSLIQGFNHMLSEIHVRTEALQVARDNLEQRVQERTGELAASLSLLNATLESTPDGIIAVDEESRVVSYNNRFLQMWGFNREQIATVDRETLMVQAAGRTRDPEVNLAWMRNLLANPNQERLDQVELRDGQIFECYTKPRRIGDQLAGCVFNFRDVTEHKRAEELLRQTEVLYRRAIAGADAVPYAYDYQTRTYAFIDEGIERLVGYRPEEVTSQLWKSIIQESVMRGDSTGLDKQQAARLVTEGKLRVWRCDMRVLTRDGRQRWISDVSVQKQNEGQVVGSMGILQDITDRKQAEAELAYERDLLKALMDNLPDAIYFKDLQSRFVRVSRSKLMRCYETACQIHEAANPGGGLPPRLQSVESFAETLAGKSDFDFYPEDRAQDAYEDEQRILREGEPMIGKLENTVRPDGREYWCLTTKLPWRGPDGAIIGTFGASKDISELKEAEAKLQVAHQELVEISRRAGMAEVATSVLHNVGNVLNSVNTSASVVTDTLRSSRRPELGRFASLLRQHERDLATFLTQDGRAAQVITFLEALNQQLSSEQANVLGELTELTRNVEHIKEIVAMQQSYARVSGVVEYQSLPALVEDALRIQSPALARHKVQVVRRFQPVPELLLDKHKVLQILINLIGNAKYALSDSSASERRLTLGIEMRDGKVRIGVQDNGVGIPQENLTRIFAHGYTTRPTGHGFGLHSGALAAREMGGLLTVHSDGPGHGATFTLELPAQTQAELV